MPANFRLVKTLSHLQEEQRYSDEVVLEHVGLVLTRGTVVEIFGHVSSGKTSIALNLLTLLTNAGELCAVVDSGDGFDPCSAFLAGVKQENLLWVRCGGDIEKAFMSTDYLVQAKGFGAIWLNLSALAEHKLRLVPKTYWYRYRTRIKETPTILLATSTESVSGSASQQSFALLRENCIWSGRGRFKLLREFHLKYNRQKDFFGSPTRMQIEMDYRELRMPSP